MISAYDYYTKIVTPTVNEFLEQNTVIRRAFLACTAALHTVDYVMQNKELDMKKADNLVLDFRRKSGEECLAFQVVEGFAQASKHCRLSRRASRGFHSGNQSVEGGAFLDDAPVEDLFLNDPGVLMVHWNDESFNLAETLREALTFLESKFPEIVALPSASSAA